MISIGVADMRTKRNTDEQVIHVFDQQTGVWPVFLYVNLQILTVGIICKKFC